MNDSFRTESLSPATKGSIGQYAAVVWLLEKGYEVFNNVTEDGPIDIIAVDKTTGEAKLIDVKRVFSKKSGTRTLSDAQRRLGVTLLYVGPKGVGWTKSHAV